MNVGYARVSKVLHQNIDTTSPAGRLLFTMLGDIAEFRTVSKRSSQIDYF